ncbi:hypothetical protein [Lutispora thermophila]|uniref:GIY-YIG domain-containing protein n=1 Tax=Lutispora thermophila DSM 19022 TaxID=1122184 RepID=A0A1M6HIK9_9FIRM|nr:hypothetical protein [Lutispora thermophila]SHJ21979.1 hypothetical protein SAMN02745176_02806 [Lutispora thermophila DSM 19022]
MQIEYIKNILEEIFYRNKNLEYGYISEIKEFKDIKNYVSDISRELEKGNKRRWIGAIYKYIYEQQLGFSDYKNYDEITNDNGVYVIADYEGNVLYIGKCDKKDYDVFTRLFDHLVPELSENYPYGQVYNNTPEIWNNEIIKSRNLKIFICSNINFDPELLEVYLIARYKLKYGYYPRYNRETARPFARKPLFDSIIVYTDFIMGIIDK